MGRVFFGGNLVKGVQEYFNHDWLLGKPTALRPESWGGLMARFEYVITCFAWLANNKVEGPRRHHLHIPG